MRKEYRELTTNTLLFAVGNVSVKIIQFLLLPLLTIKLSTTDYNTADLLASTLELLTPILMLGLLESVFRFAINTDYEQVSVFVNAVIMTLPGFIMIGLGACIANAIFPADFWYTFSLLYATSTTSTIIANYVRGKEKVKTFSFSGIAQAATLVLASFVLVYAYGFGLKGYLFAMIIAHSVRICVLCIFGKPFSGFSFRKHDKKLLKLMLLYSLPLIPNSISWWLVHVANKYISTAILGSSTTGIYSAASKLPSIINMLSTIFLQAWTISAVKTVDSVNKGKFNSKIFRFFSTFVLLCASILYVILPYISRFLLKGEFYNGWSYSALLIFASVLTCYSSYFGAFYGANFKNKMVFVSTITGAIVNVSFTFALIWVIGVYALLISSVMAYLTIVVIRLVDTRRFSLIRIHYSSELFSIGILLTQSIIITVFHATLWVQLVLFSIMVAVRFYDIISIFDMIKEILTGCRRKN